MSLKLLGDGFDIHGGGSDLVFPHHENEIAQAVGAGHEFARYWMHNGMVNVDGEKMSKSLGNFVTLVDVLDQYDPRVPAARAADALPQADGDRREGALRRGEGGRAPRRPRPPARADELPAAAVGDVAPFRDAMDDDFDTPAALAYVFELVRDANVALDEDLLETAAMAFATVQELAGALGLELRADAPEADAEIDALVEAREAARRAEGLGRGRPHPRRALGAGHRRRGHAARPRVAPRVSKGGSDLGGEQVEGRRAVLELLRAGKRRPRAIYLSRTVNQDEIVKEIVERAGGLLKVGRAGTDRADGAHRRAPGRDRHGAPAAPADLDEMLTVDRAFLVAVDGVTDPRNLGAIMRSAETAGATGLVMPRHRSANVTPVVAKAAAGAIEYLPIALVGGIPAAIDRAARGLLVGRSRRARRPQPVRPRSRRPADRAWCSAPRARDSPA